jgi:hypothetical protein
MEESAAAGVKHVGVHARSHGGTQASLTGAAVHRGAACACGNACQTPEAAGSIADDCWGRTAAPGCTDSDAGTHSTRDSCLGRGNSHRGLGCGGYLQAWPKHGRSSSRCCQRELCALGTCSTDAGGCQVHGARSRSVWVGTIFTKKGYPQLPCIATVRSFP